CAVRWATDVSPERPRSTQDALVLEAGNNVRIAACAVLSISRMVEKIVARGHDDSSHLLRNDCVLHIEIDGLHRAYLRTDSALASSEMATMQRIDAGSPRDGLRERDIDGFGRAQTLIKSVWRLCRRAFLHAKATTGASFPIYVGRFLPDLDSKIAYVSIDGFDLTGGVQGDIFLL